MKHMEILLLQSPSQLSLHLKSLRKSRKLTQAAMAKRLQITQERYSTIERHPELLAEVETLRKRVALLESAGNALLDGMDGAHRNLANVLAAQEKTT